MVCEVAEKMEDMELDRRNPETTGMLMWFLEYIGKALQECDSWGEPEDEAEEEEMLEYLGILGQLQITVMTIRFGGMLDE